MKRLFLVGLIAFAAMFGFSSNADAAFRLRIEDPAANSGNGNGVVITDQGVADSWNTGAGHPYDGAHSIVYMGSIGVFSLSVTTGVESPAFQDPNSYVGIDLSNISISSSGAGSLRLILEADGFNIPNDGEVLEVTNVVGGSLSAGAGSSVTFSSYANHDNGTPNLGAETTATPVNLAAVTGIGAAPAVSTTQTFNTAGFNGTAKTSFVKSGDYSLYSVVTINFTSAGTVSFDSATATSPAPAGLVLALTAAPFGLGAWIRRRRSSVQA